MHVVSKQRSDDDDVTAESGQSRNESPPVARSLGQTVSTAGHRKNSVSRRWSFSREIYSINVTVSRYRRRAVVVTHETVIAAPSDYATSPPLSDIYLAGIVFGRLCLQPSSVFVTVCSHSTLLHRWTVKSIDIELSEYTGNGSGFTPLNATGASIVLRGGDVCCAWHYLFSSAYMKPF